MTPEQYPFGQKTKKKYEIPIDRNIKKALSADNIRKIKQVNDLREEAEFARDIWLFSFYCGGMNMTDICHLKYENIQDLKYSQECLAIMLNNCQTFLIL
jgi:site-specific recombinase XerD